MSEFRCPSCEFVSDDPEAMIDHRVAEHPPSGPLAPQAGTPPVPPEPEPSAGAKRGRWPFVVAAAFVLLLIGASVIATATLAGDDDEPADTAATSPSDDDPQDDADDDTGPSSDEGQDQTPCQVAGQEAADGDDFDLEACTTLAAFRSAYRAAGDGGLSDSEAIDLLAPLCARNTEAPLCEDAIDILLSPTPTTQRSTKTTAPPAGSIENPIPAGTPIPGDDWTFTVIGFEGEVGGAVAAANRFNESAPEGSQWVRMRIRATYEGEGSGSPMFSLRFNLAGQSGATYSEGLVASGSGTDAGKLSDQPETYPGGTVEGWVYYIVSDADAAAPILGFAPNITYTDVPGGVGFFVVKA